MRSHVQFGLVKRTEYPGRGRSMERFQQGSVVIAQFIFTDASQTKNRPAIVIANLRDEDYIMCSVTSRCRQNDPYQIELKKDEITGGDLRHDSFIRPNLIMTVNQTLILRKVGHLPDHKLKQVIDKIISIITNPQ
ncbi:MAG: type II toxin-antitoxin system PemK/MazF family toxin [Thermodesulfobacteriota bacterium]